MKRIYLLVLVLVLSFTSGQLLLGQKAKFKNTLCKVQKIKLPHNYSEPDQRSYDLELKGIYADNIEDNKRLFGWQQDSENPNVKAVVSVYGYRYGAPKKHSEKKVSKDKDGKVTSRWTEYWYTNSGTGKGTLYVYGFSNPFKYKSKDKDPKKKSKWEKKLEEKKEAEKKALADNPFLSKENIEEAEEAGDSNMGTDTGLENTELELVNKLNIDQTIEVSTNRHRSSSKALAEYKSNHLNTIQSYRDEYPELAYSQAVGELNRLYGYAPTKGAFYLKKMKTEKHPEYKMWNDACQATQTLFKTFKYNEPIADYQKNFDPIVDYFAGILKKIPEGDKKQKKLRKAAFSNTANILYFLDRHDALITLCESYLDSKKLSKLAKRNQKYADLLKAKLAFHQLDSRHMLSDEVVSEDEIEEEEVQAEEEEGK